MKLVEAVFCLLVTAAFVCSRKVCEPKWTEYANTNIGGATGIGQRNLADCKSACVQDKLCNGVVWGDYNGSMCHLVGPRVYGGMKTRHGFTLHDYRRCAGGCAHKWTEYPGKYIEGGTRFVAPNSDVCKRSCIYDRLCTGIDWTDSGECWLLGPYAIGGMKNKSGVTNYDLHRCYRSYPDLTFSCHHNENGIYVWTGGERIGGIGSEFALNTSAGHFRFSWTHYQNWAPQQPDRDDESCVNLWPKYNYRWNNEYCYNQHCYVCQFDVHE